MPRYIKLKPLPAGATVRDFLDAAPSEAIRQVLRRAFCADGDEDRVVEPEERAALADALHNSLARHGLRSRLDS